MKLDAEGWLVAEDGDPGVTRYPTCRTCIIADPPLGIVWHWTAGVGRSNIWSGALARSIQTYDPMKDRAASWHFLISRDGSLYQSVPAARGAWHVGRSGKVCGVNYPNVNSVLLGCEIENAGRLLRVEGFPDRFYCWPYWSNPDAPERERQFDPHWEMPPGRAVEAADVPDFKVAGGWFDPFTPEQEATAEKLVRALVARYGWDAGALNHGHYEYAYPTKEDPGPLWMRTVLPRIFGRVLFCSPSNPV